MRMLADAHISSLGYLLFKMAQKTAFEAKERLYTTGEEIQRLLIIDLYT